MLSPGCGFGWEIGSGHISAPACLRCRRNIALQPARVPVSARQAHRRDSRMVAGGHCVQLPKRASFSQRSRQLPQEICGFLDLSYKTLFNFTIFVRWRFSPARLGQLSADGEQKNG
jgi:hypothetical protein